MGAEPVVGHVEADKASLYRITVFPQVGRGSLQPQFEAEVTNVLSPVSISNGIAWSSDDTLMYYIDTPTRRVDVFDFNSEKGTIGEHGLLARNTHRLGGLPTPRSAGAPDWKLRGRRG